MLKKKIQIKLLMSVNKIMVGQSESHNLMKNKLIGICCKK